MAGPPHDISGTPHDEKPTPIGKGPGALNVARGGVSMLDANSCWTLFVEDVRVSMTAVRQGSGRRAGAVYP